MSAPIYDKSKIMMELLKKFFSDKSILERAAQLAVLQDELQAANDAIKTACETYNNSRVEQTLPDGTIFIADPINCDDPIELAKYFPVQADIIAAIKTKINALNPPDLSSLKELIKLLINSSKK